MSPASQAPSVSPTGHTPFGCCLVATSCPTHVLGEKSTPRPLELTHWKRLWCWEGLGAGGEGDDRGWDGWVASLTRWTWVWVNSGSWWWTGRPGVLWFLGSQRVGHYWVMIWSSWLLKVSTYSATAAKSLQSCPTLCDPIDVSPPGSPIPGILQARTLEWVAISFSNAWKWKSEKVKVKSLSCVWLLATPWTAAYQAPPSMGFSRQEYWSGVPLASLLFLARPCLSFSFIFYLLLIFLANWKIPHKCNGRWNRL